MNNKSIKSGIINRVSIHCMMITTELINIACYVLLYYAYIHKFFLYGMALSGSSHGIFDGKQRSFI